MSSWHRDESDPEEAEEKTKTSPAEKKRSPERAQQWDVLKVTSIRRHQILMTSEPPTGPPRRTNKSDSRGGFFFSFFFRRPHAALQHPLVVQLQPSFSPLARPRRSSFQVAALPEFFIQKKGHRQPDGDLSYLLGFAVITYWSDSTSRMRKGCSSVCYLRAPAFHINRAAGLESLFAAAAEPKLIFN